MMEAALRYELNKAIPELNDEIYPTNAPEEVLRPYLIYTRINTEKLKTLKGYCDNEHLSYMFSILTPKYGDMMEIRKKVVDLLLSLPETTIGIENIYIEDIDINNISETYEFNLKVNRGIIDFTIYY